MYIIDCEASFYKDEYDTLPYIKQWVTEAYKFESLDKFIEFEKRVIIENITYETAHKLIRENKW
jgi:hypothetical protein